MRFIVSINIYDTECTKAEEAWSSCFLGFEIRRRVSACIKAQFMGLVNMVYGVSFYSPRNRKPPNDLPPRKMKNDRRSNNDRGETKTCLSSSKNYSHVFIKTKYIYIYIFTIIFRKEEWFILTEEDVAKRTIPQLFRLINFQLYFLFLFFFFLLKLYHRTDIIGHNLLKEGVRRNNLSSLWSLVSCVVTM